MVKPRDPAAPHARTAYMGVLCTESVAARFDEDTLSSTPEAYAHLAGLSRLFAAKLSQMQPGIVSNSGADAAALLAMTVSCRYGRTLVSKQGSGTPNSWSFHVVGFRFTWSWNPHESLPCTGPGSARSKFSSSDDGEVEMDCSFAWRTERDEVCAGG